MSIFEVSQTVKFNNQIQILEEGTPKNAYIIYFVCSGFFSFYYGMTKTKDLNILLKKFKNRYNAGEEAQINALFNLPHADPKIFYIDVCDTKEEATDYLNQLINGNIWSVNNKILTHEQRQGRTQPPEKKTSKKKTPKK